MSANVEKMSTTNDEGATPDVRAGRLVVCAKSRWVPPIRREHSLALAAAGAGWTIDLVEQAYDVRDLRGRLSPPRVPPPPPGVRVSSYFTPVPGHRGEAFRRLDALALRRALTHLIGPEPPEAVVVNAPWNFDATGVLPSGVRRVLDLGDDWATLLPRRRELVRRAYERIADQADEIIVVAPTLGELFDRPVTVVPNAVAPELLATPPTAPPGGRRMTYLGTLSERLDAVLLREVVALLPDWTLDLVGPCHYAGMGGRPAPEVVDLVVSSGGRVRLLGPVGRDEVSAVLDAADVLVLPNVVSYSRGQDSMKLYDYAARGRPIVATPIRLPSVPPPALTLAESPVAFAEAVRAADGTPASGNRTWAEGNSYRSRLPAWLGAVTGRSAVGPPTGAA